MRVAFGRNIVTDICVIFGLDPKMTDAIDITLRVDDAVRVTTTRYVTDEEAEKLTALMRHFYLAESDENGALK